MFTPATPQELLDCNHSKEHNLKEEWEGKTMQIGLCNVHCRNALSEREPAFSLSSACTQHGMKRVLQVTKPLPLGE